MDFPRGSEWAKWDLHVHTASSYDAEYKGSDSNKLLCEALIDNMITAVAITDHFFIDSKRITNLRKEAPSITFFPGVELRTDKGASNLHVILIFSEKLDVEVLSNEFNVVMRGKKARSSEKEETIYWRYEDIIDFAKERGGLVSLHAGGKTNGIDKEITNATLFNQAIKEDISEFVDFFEVGKIKDVENYNKHVFEDIDRKPLIMCSDCHNPKEYSTKENLWIKANPTFEGLRQCIFQPEERVFIGDIPPKLEMVAKNKNVYINSIAVTKNKEAKNINDEWFGFMLPLNCGLTAIIGNKGSGKSALSDIIGHLCNSNSMDEASFLNSDRFRKPPKKLADDYSGCIEWFDGKKDSNISLGEIDRESNIEYAQYLPQKYIEKVCNDLGELFQEEINKVIFSYIDITEKEGLKNLQELIDQKTEGIFFKITDIQNELDTINKGIIKLEDKRTLEYKEGLKDSLAKREDDLRRHENNKPKEVDKPEKDLSSEYQEQLDKLLEEIDEIERTIGQKKKELTDVNKKVDRLYTLELELINVIEKIDKVNKGLVGIVDEFGFDKESFIISYTTPLQEMRKKLKHLKDNQAELKNVLDNTEESNAKSLVFKLKKLEDKKEEIISRVNTDEKAYQKYLDDMKEWEKTKTGIIGGKEVDGSIENLKSEIEYVEKMLNIEYRALTVQRLLKVNELIIQKKRIAYIYASIYAPVEKEIKKLLTDLEEKIDFSIDISIVDKEIDTKLLSYINKTYGGIFGGKTKAKNKMDELLKIIDVNNSDSIREYICSVLECINEDIDIASKKVKDREGFYRLLTYIDYINVEFSLKMGGRSLMELSPGERGIVLLVFYLALNKKDIPLIIDQPEDNLDNQSVFKKLVHCICEAKRQRQVIIVTHNPNIAIACDAEQIIYCSIDKNKNKISYYSGSIENEETRQKVIDVLEGTMPAFDLRKRKYTEVY